MRCCQQTPVFRVGAVLLLLSVASLAWAQNGDKKESTPVTPGKVQKRTYDFKDAGKEMEYALFVPTTSSDGKRVSATSGRSYFNRELPSAGETGHFFIRKRKRSENGKQLVGKRKRDAANPVRHDICAK